MKKLLLFIAFVGFFFQSKAQEQFVSKGKIIYEKKVNMLRKLEDWDMPDSYKDQVKKYQMSNWDYSFNEEKSLYKAAKKDESPTGNMYFIFGSSENTAQMYTDFTTGKRVIKKPIMNVDYLLDDTIPKLEWKIQQDVRVIAGYECRKAIARFNDTVYAVAFYTDKILAKGGPEGFTGLPGMILGLAIPRYYTTWFATKVELVAEDKLDLAVPSKGDKATTDKDYKKLVDLFTRYDSQDPLLKNQTPEDIRKRIYALVL